MPKKNRLSRADFDRMRGFKRIHGALFSVAYGEISGRSLPGGACVVSTKVSKKAPERNRIKRVVRPALAELLRNSASPSIVLYAKKAVFEADPREIRAEIENLAKKLKQG